MANRAHSAVLVCYRIIDELPHMAPNTGFMPREFEFA